MMGRLDGENSNEIDPIYALPKTLINKILG